jgi:DNA polymerase I-like protein with 3'-5' exonuclease and polymerase domains
MNVVLDIETDSLDAKKIHCIVAKDLETSQVHVWDHNNLDQFKSWCDKVDNFIMHNGISFDVPILRRLLGVNIKIKQMRDTLVMSQLFNPVREKGHSLKAWGEILHYPKGEHENFAMYTEDMLEYCKNDVDLTEQVYKKLRQEGRNFSELSINMEHKIRAIIDQQETNGFALDIRKTIGLLSRLSDEAHDLVNWSKVTFQPTVVELKTKPNKIVPFNIGSRQQIAACLIDLDWKPKHHTDKGNIIVSEEILNKIDLEEAQKFSRYFLLQKRIAQVQSWINTYRDNTGRVHGRVLTLRTITGRMAHMSPNMAQVPAIRSPFGFECRDCWTVSNPHTHKLVGTDASGLELRCLAHLMDNKDYTNEILNGDVHTANMKMAGITDRDQAKTFIYAFLYGAGAEKIGKIVGGSRKKGQDLIDKFLSNMPDLKRVRNNVQKAAQRHKIQGVDGRYLHTRSPHSALNTLIQGAGASVCKDWLINMTLRVNRKGLDVKLVASIHDEYQFEVAKKDIPQFGLITKEGIKDTERNLKFKCPLDSTWKDGETWATTH